MQRVIKEKDEQEKIMTCTNQKKTLIRKYDGRVEIKAKRLSRTAESQALVAGIQNLQRAD